MPDLITFVGVSASVCSAISSLPQLIKIIKDKNAVSVSNGMLIILILGLSLWIYYGILLEDIIIISSNTLSVLINILVLSFSVYYKN